MDKKISSPLIAAAAGLAGAGYILWRVYKQWRGTRLPQYWVRVGVIEDLLAYPIKSCQWVELQEAECTYMGLQHGWLKDRTLMVIDKNGNFISARSYPEMLRVKTTFDGALMTLSHPNMEPIVVHMADVLKTASFKARVWNTPVEVYSCGWEAGEWFSRLLLKETDSLRLVSYASDKCRTLRANTNPIYNFRDTDTGAFPDETSYNMINKASVEDLKKRIGDAEAECTPRQFRPNFVVSGASPLAEDEWKFVKVGSNIFEVIKPCFRCVMTTIDPETAIKNPKAEPLATLKRYRQVKDPAMRKSAGSSPCMGLQLALRSAPDRVAVGDIVYVPGPPPPFVGI